MPYMYALYVCLICVPYMRALYVCLICVPSMCALYMCVWYMYTLCMYSRKRMPYMCIYVPYMCIYRNEMQETRLQEDAHVDTSALSHELALSHEQAPDTPKP